MARQGAILLLCCLCAGALGWRPDLDNVVFDEAPTTSTPDSASLLHDSASLLRFRVGGIQHVEQQDKAIGTKSGYEGGGNPDAGGGDAGGQQTGGGGRTSGANGAGGGAIGGGAGAGTNGDGGVGGGASGARGAQQQDLSPQTPALRRGGQAETGDSGGRSGPAAGPRRPLVGKKQSGVFSCGAACLLSVAARFGIMDTKGICNKPGTCQATPLRQCNVGDVGKGAGAGAKAGGKNNDVAMGESGESGGASSLSTNGASPGSSTASFIEQGASFSDSTEQQQSSVSATTDDAASSAPTPFHHDSQTGTPKLHTAPGCSLSSAAEAQMYRLTSNMGGDEWSPDMIFRKAQYV